MKIHVSNINKTKNKVRQKNKKNKKKIKNKIKKNKTTKFNKNKARCRRSSNSWSACADPEGNGCVTVGTTSRILEASTRPIRAPIGI